MKDSSAPDYFTLSIVISWFTIASTGTKPYLEVSPYQNSHYYPLFPTCWVVNDRPCHFLLL